MENLKPKQGLIYKLDPNKVIAKCKNNHFHVYQIRQIKTPNCKESSCIERVNPSYVERYQHPHVVWMNNYFFETNQTYEFTFTVIPLSSKLNSITRNLNTVHIINNTKNNIKKTGLKEKSYALVHQISVVDAGCFKNQDGSWKTSIGMLNDSDMKGIEKRLRYYLGLS
ncbi:type II toxin-antitoxin system PemK/MazF family toxin [Spirulina sp. 06S082]|uniref:type II toxin-antitoxin system PemK/MazF family toxin n=1 Tax=Spirulina sp. 06S082 TaxID=3110248 RepID=UPI002B20D297|nr:type II toxin-antitoxin system PemK/MazF family toxin [Spirulina sp. 06S082]MEA5470413.1 type II toxin-antitoxin system PemK/MazF family toxin [Spirulina sp. 06S082]